MNDWKGEPFPNLSLLDQQACQLSKGKSANIYIDSNISLGGSWLWYIVEIGFDSGSSSK